MKTISSFGLLAANRCPILNCTEIEAVHHVWHTNRKVQMVSQADIMKASVLTVELKSQLCAYVWSYC